MVLLSLTSRVNNHAVSFSRRLCCQPAVPASFDSCKVLLVDPPKPNPPSLHLVLGTSLMACVAKFGNTNIQTHTHTHSKHIGMHTYITCIQTQLRGNLMACIECNVYKTYSYIYIYLFVPCTNALTRVSMVSVECGSPDESTTAILKLKQYGEPQIAGSSTPT